MVKECSVLYEIQDEQRKKVSLGARDARNSFSAFFSLSYMSLMDHLRVDVSKHFLVVSF